MEEYAEEVRKLRRLGQELDLSEEQINRVIEDSFHFLKTEGTICDLVDQPDCRRPTQSSRRVWLSSCVFCVLLIVSASLLHRSSLFGYRKTVNNYIERNVQDMIYPGMKLFRKLMLPVVNQFPSLTGKSCSLSSSSRGHMYSLMLVSRLFS